MKDVHPLPFFEPEVVLYHADCPDGFGAAWAVLTRCPTARFVTARHGQPPPDGLTGKRLVIVDFSYARPTIEQLAGATSAFAILDHHVTAQQALGDLPYAHYEQNKSGAVLAWEWTHRTAAPWLLQYLQDKDLHRWQLPESREINMGAAGIGMPPVFPCRSLMGNPCHLSQPPTESSRDRICVRLAQSMVRIAVAQCD